MHTVTKKQVPGECLNYCLVIKKQKKNKNCLMAEVQIWIIDYIILKIHPTFQDILLTNRCEGVKSGHSQGRVQTVQRPELAAFGPWDKSLTWTMLDEQTRLFFFDWCLIYFYPIKVHLRSMSWKRMFTISETFGKLTFVRFTHTTTKLNMMNATSTADTHTH